MTVKPEEGTTPHIRYREKFGTSVPDYVWQRHPKELLPHVERAIRENRPLTQDDLLRIQGLGPMEPGRIY